MSNNSGAAGAKIAVAIMVTGILTLGSMGAAAYSASLPTELQTAAHELIGAPDANEVPTDDASATPTDETSAEPNDDPSLAPSPEPSASAEPEVEGDKGKGKGPDALGRSAYGLCNAYAHGGLNETSMAFAALEVAAGIAAAEEAAIAVIETGGETIDDEAGEPAPLSGIEAYCATVPSPGKSGEHKKDKADKVKAEDEAETKKDKAEKADKADKAKAKKAKIDRIKAEKAKADKAEKDKARSTDEAAKTKSAASKTGKGKGAGKSGGR